MWKPFSLICKSIAMGAFHPIILLAQFAVLKYNSIKINFYREIITTRVVVNFKSDTNEKQL